MYGKRLEKLFCRITLPTGYTAKKASRVGKYGYTYDSERALLILGACNQSKVVLVETHTHSHITNSMK